jgi:hypothetical protein
LRVNPRFGATYQQIFLLPASCYFSALLIRNTGDASTKYLLVYKGLHGVTLLNRRCVDVKSCNSFPTQIFRSIISSWIVCFKKSLIYLIPLHWDVMFCSTKAKEIILNNLFPNYSFWAYSFPRFMSAFPTTNKWYNFPSQKHPRNRQNMFHTCGVGGGWTVGRGQRFTATENYSFSHFVLLFRWFYWKAIFKIGSNAKVIAIFVIG